MDGDNVAPLKTPTSISSGSFPRQNQYAAQILVDRWVRDAEALRRWSQKAKECVQFNEGDQWNEADTKLHMFLGRPMVTINKINRLVRLIYGFYAANRGDVSFAPSDDSLSTEQIAEVLSKLYFQENKRHGGQWVDDEVFIDGITTGRGFWDVRMDFERNDLGETITRADDPFSTYLQHDADTYDIQLHNRVTTSRWASVDEIGATYGDKAAEAIKTIVKGDGWQSFPSNYYWDSGEEVTPPRKFMGEEGIAELSPWWIERQSELVDYHLKNVRVLDMQHKLRMRAPCFVDLETGDWTRIPEFFDDQKIAKVLYHAEKMNNPIKVVKRMVNRVRWTTLVGDIMIWDDWSPYDWFTKVPYFPYFRRGKTRGMLEDLLDPQRELNKKRSLRVEILGRTINGGWSIHEGSMAPEEEANLRTFGAAPGVIIKWSGDQPWQAPQRLDAQPRNMEAQAQEQDASGDILEISGINQSALGDLDRVQSGKAVIERKKQAVVGANLYFQNFTRSQAMKAKLFLCNFQRFYTEERIVREIGESGHVGTMIINQRMQSPDGLSVLGKLNDITLGKYSVNVKEIASAATFEATQFEEMLALFEALGDIGKEIAMTNPGLVLEMSNMPRKAEWKEAIAAAVGIRNAEEARLQREEMIRQSGITNVPNQTTGEGQVLPSPVPQPPHQPMQPPAPVQQPPQPPMAAPQQQGGSFGQPA